MSENHNLTTPSHRLFVARAVATEDTLLDLTTKGDYANMPSSRLDLFAKDVVTPSNTPVFPNLQSNGIAFMFCASTAHSKTFNWHLKAWRNENGACKYVAIGTGVTGTQAVVKYPHNGVAVANMFWADTLEVSWYNWYKRVDSTDTDGHNSIAEIWLDACGWRYWLVEIITTDTSSPATNVAAYWGYF